MDGLIGGQVDTKLSGEADWATWKFKLTVLLRVNNLLLGITDGTTQPPVKEESKKDYENWAEKDAKAQSIIVTRIEYRVLILVYEQISGLSVHLPQQKSFEVKYKKNEAMSEYLGRVEAIFDNLKFLGADVNKSMAITKFI
ncbi:hypothetical protein PR048_010294 [Dryococelus australis]|uniref:Gag protein n=1 Tax=Dryococelus australis TaxID=614101 RepID=A0ABQ9I3F7_9NEOP|nr:hypothetical protein PR048_010294 [Dryococelus australis]